MIYTNFIETTNQGHKMTQDLINQFTQALAAYDRAELKHLYKSLTEEQAKANNIRLMNNAAKVFGLQR
jgi:hypothetical protein